MTGWLIETLVTTTLLMLVVLALRAPVARMFGAGWAYALWAVPALRLVLPPLPQLTPELSLPAVAAYIPAAAGGTAPLPVEAGPGQWVPLMLAMWAGGAVIFLTLQWLSYRSFVHRLRGSARPARPPSYGGIATLVSDAVDGPLALGLLNRRIVIPADFLRRYSESERRLALDHELTHHRRGDIWWNMAATVVLALNWFNPVAWIAFRAFRADQELACDAAVAARASIDERCDYARALVKSASRPGLIAACALNSASQLKRRLRMMRGHRISAARRAGGGLAFASFALAGFAVGSPAATQVAQEAPQLAQLAGFAAPAPSFAAPEPKLALIPTVPKRELKPKSRRSGSAAAAPLLTRTAPEEPRPQLATVPDEAIGLPAATPHRKAVRLVRVERQELVRMRPGEKAHFYVWKRGPEPGPAAMRATAHAEVHRAVQLAEARGALERIAVQIRTSKEGE